MRGTGAGSEREVVFTNEDVLTSFTGQLPRGTLLAQCPAYQTQTLGANRFAEAVIDTL